MAAGLFYTCKTGGADSHIANEEIAVPPGLSVRRRKLFCPKFPTQGRNRAWCLPNVEAQRRHTASLVHCAAVLRLERLGLVPACGGCAGASRRILKGLAAKDSRTRAIQNAPTASRSTSPLAARLLRKATYSRILLMLPRLVRPSSEARTRVMPSRFRIACTTALRNPRTWPPPFVTSTSGSSGKVLRARFVTTSATHSGPCP